MARLFSKNVPLGMSARDEAIQRFGKRPEPLHILQAMIDSAPGCNFREWIRNAVLVEAAKMAIDFANKEKPQPIAFPKEPTS